MKKKYAIAYKKDEVTDFMTGLTALRLDEDCLWLEQ